MDVRKLSIAAALFGALTVYPVIGARTPNITRNGGRATGAAEAKRAARKRRNVRARSAK